MQGPRPASPSPCSRRASRLLRVVAASLAAATLAGLSGCGYRLARGYHSRAGAERVHVRVFENDSTDPELGATVTADLRDELARRGASAGPDGAAVLEGWVRASEGVPSTFGAALFGLTVELHGRLTVQGKTVDERTVERHGDHLGGADPLEAEGRRAVALRRLAREAAQELLRALEADAEVR